MQIIKSENLKNMIYKIDLALSNVEVKGDSVQHISNARTSLKEIFSLIEEVEEKEEEIKKEE